MEDKKYLTLIKENGEEEKFEIITVFKSIKTKKNYIVYTDNKYGGDNNLNIYASIFYPDDDTRFEDVSSDEEWDEIRSVVDVVLGGEDNGLAWIYSAVMS